MKRIIALITALTITVFSLTGCMSAMRNSIDTLSSLSDTLTGVQEKLDQMPGSNIDLTEDIAKIKAEEKPQNSPEPEDGRIISEHKPIALSEYPSLAKEIANEGALSYAVVQNGAVKLSGGVGNAQANIVADGNTVYHMGQATRLYTATAVLHALQNSKFVLETQVVKVLKDFKMRDKRFNQITVLNLLNNTSALPTFYSLNANTYGATYAPYKYELLASLTTEYLNADPGSIAAFCPTGYALSEIVLEKITGTNYTQYIKENIIDVAKLEHTATSFANGLDSVYAQKTVDKFSVSQIKNNATAYNGVVGSAADLAMFAKSLFETEIINQESLDKMLVNYSLKSFNPAPTDSKKSYGLGFDNILAQPYLSMGLNAYKVTSSVPGATLIAIPELKLYVAVASNDVNTDQAADALMLATLFEQDRAFVAPTVQAQSVAAMSSDMMQYAGCYATDDSMIQVNLSQNGELTLSRYVGDSWLSDATKKYTYRQNNRFSNGEEELFFIDNNNTTYLCKRAVQSVLVGACEYTIGQKINPELQAVPSEWAQRNAPYLINNAVHTAKINNLSLILGQDNAFAGFVTANGTPLKIATQNSAGVFTTLANSNNPNLGTLYFVKDDLGINRAVFGGINYIDSSQLEECIINQIYEGEIANENVVTWYKLPKGSKQYVSFKGNARYIVLDENCMPIYDSKQVGKADYIRTPKGGYLAVMGEKNTYFRVAPRLLSEGEITANPAGYNEILPE